MVFNGVYALSGSSGTLGVYASLSLLSAVVGPSGSANDDYSHTGTLTLTLPQGVSYTSDSGVFLTQAVATPEPSSLWLTIIAVALVALGKIGLRRISTAGRKLPPPATHA